MRNITPRSYCHHPRNDSLNSSEKTESIKYYQTYDVAHIEPYDENNPLTNDFENLIAMCKSCHIESEPRLTL
ncbi:MAG: hypothetical protein HON23_02460 [Rickettsiales bacterium]|jgi:hypothetical protein|nr:hypothetical protein [Rickettsiales bacterium]